MKWRVWVTRETTETTEVEVEADSQEAANEAALLYVDTDEFRATVNSETWELDDWSGDPYIADDEAAEEITDA